MKQTAMSLLALALALGNTGQVRASLIGFWKFNESSGSIAHDSVGSINGTLMGNASFAPGSGPGGGGAIRLNIATDDYVNMGYNFGFVSGGSFSLQAWIKTNPGDTTGMVAVAKHHSGNVSGYFLAVNDVHDGTGGANNAHFYASYPTSGNSSITVNDGQWHQLVGVYNTTSDTISIYVDGQFQSSSSGASPIIGNDAPFLVGGLLNGGTGQTQGLFNGLISDVGIWNDALSASQIQALYQQPFQTATPEPASFTLMGLSLSGLLVYEWRRRRAG